MNARKKAKTFQQTNKISQNSAVKCNTFENIFPIIKRKEMDMNKKSHAPSK